MSFRGNKLYVGHKPASDNFYNVAAYVLQPYSFKRMLRITAFAKVRKEEDTGTTGKVGDSVPM